VVYTAVSMVMLVGFATLAIDGGRLYLARTQLQATADAAAMAAVTAILIDANQDKDYLAVESEGYLRASDIGGRHEILGKSVNLPMANVVFGRIDDPSDYYAPFNTATTDYNAVRVVVQRTSTSPDGPIGLLLAAIWGNNTADVGAIAVAVLDDRVSGFRPVRDTLLPFTIHLEKYETEKAGGTDDYGYNADLGEVSRSGDDVFEVKLYPYKLSGSDTTQEEFEGSGNFGILNIGVENQGQPPVATQITSGVTGDDLEAEVGVPELEFYDESGDARTYTMTGNPGLKASLNSPLESRVGDVVGFFVHTGVTLNGSNAEYTIVGVRFGRLMDVRLNGKDKYLIVQPVLYSGPEIITDPDAPSTDLEVSRLMLAR
jgi:hypothetical protein